MAKKRTGRVRAGSAGGTRAKARKTSRPTDALQAMSRIECNDFFEMGAPEKLLAVFDESYLSDLVNVLLDVKKATVRRFFEQLIAARRRGIPELATLYYYKEYLTNPLPLRVETETGRTVPNYYAILGVPREVTADELKTAYRLLVKAYAPESFSPAMRKAGAERLAEIEDAFHNLRHPARRQRANTILPNISYL